MEYFVSTTAAASDSGSSDNVVVWALSNTGCLNPAQPPLGVRASDVCAPMLRQVVVPTIPYSIPPLALQPKGPTPLLRCINQGVACEGDPAPFFQPGAYPLDAADTRPISSYFQDGVLWTTLDTALQGPGGSDYGPDNNFGPDPVDEKAGIAYFAFQPTWASDGTLGASVVQQHYVGVDDRNMTYPSLAMGDGTTGLIGVTIVGPKTYPSSGYIKIGSTWTQRSWS